MQAVSHTYQVHADSQAERPKAGATGRAELVSAERPERESRRPM